MNRRKEKWVMGIGIGDDSAAKTVVQGAAIGTAAGAAYKAVKPLASDSFQRSIEGQAQKIEKCKDFIAKTEKFTENGAKTKYSADVKGYIAAQKDKIKNFSDAHNVSYDYLETMKAEGANFGKNIDKCNKGKLAGLRQDFNDIYKVGEEKALKNLAKDEKILTNGQPSKLRAAKETAAELGNKTAEKAAGLKDKAVAFIKEGGKKEKIKSTGTKVLDSAKAKYQSAKNAISKFAKAGNKGEIISQNKESIKNTLKKAGKMAAPAAIGVGIIFAAKTLYNKIKED